MRKVSVSYRSYILSYQHSLVLYLMKDMGFRLLSELYSFLLESTGMDNLEVARAFPSPIGVIFFLIGYTLKDTQYSTSFRLLSELYSFLC